MLQILFEVRRAWSALARSRTLALTIIATLGLGVGANVAFFQLLRELLYQPPAGVLRPNELHRVRQRFIVAGTHDRRVRQTFSYVEYATLRAAIGPAAPLSGYLDRLVSIGEGRAPREAHAVQVVGDYFGTLGIRPAIGRLFDKDEEAGDGAVAVISAELWQSQFGGSREALGRTIVVDGQRTTIIGVTEPQFDGVSGRRAELWIPFVGWAQNTDSSTLSNSFDLRLEIIARIPPRELASTASLVSNVLQRAGVIRDPSAQADLASISDVTNPLQSSSVLPILYRLWWAAGIILVLAWANVTNLLLIRLATREREIAVRFALGASRRRFLTALGVEHGLLALGGCGVALIVAIWMHDILASSIARGDSTGARLLHGPTIAAALGVVVVASLASTAVAAALGPHRRIADALGSNHRGVTRRGGTVRSAVMILQAALCVLLVTGALLVLRSFSQIRREWVPPAVDELLVASIPFATRAAPGDAHTGAEFVEMERSLATLPFVERVATASNTPIQSAMFRRFFVPGQDSVMTPEELPASLAAVSPDYFRVMGIEVVDGHPFSASDTRDAPPVVIVSAYMASRVWPGQSPLGRCIKLGSPSAACRTVVGVVEDVHIMKLRERPQMRYYAPLAQANDPWTPRAILVRSRPGSTATVAAAIQRLVSTRANRAAGWSVARFASIIEPELRPWRVAAVTFSGLAALAAIMSAVGVYGAVAHSLNERRGEIAVRLALGATPHSIAKLVARVGLKLVTIGVTIGMIAFLALGGVTGPIVYGISFYDPIVLLAAPLLLLTVAVLASAPPARRALRIDPLESLLRE